jgi:hypothetical protein
VATLDDVRPSDTIGALKVMVQEQSGIPSDQQRLIFAGVELADDRMVSDYGIMPYSPAIHLVLRRNGHPAPQTTVACSDAAP